MLLFMKIRGMLLGFASLLAVATAWGDGPPFSQVVNPGDFEAAGLQKLTPAELARLDQLVTAYKTGLLEQARQETARAEAAKAAAEVRAQKAEAKAAQASAAAEAAQAKPGILTRAEALITPGTKIRYQPIESRIVGEVTGWDPTTVFLLENGQRWQVSNYSHYFNGAAVRNPAVTIRPVRVFGGFEMEIEGLGTMRVRLINGPTYRDN